MQRLTPGCGGGAEANQWGVPSAAKPNSGSAWLGPSSPGRRHCRRICVAFTAQRRDLTLVLTLALALASTLISFHKITREPGPNRTHLSCHLPTPAI